MQRQKQHPSDGDQFSPQREQYTGEELYALRVEAGKQKDVLYDTLHKTPTQQHNHAPAPALGPERRREGEKGIPEITTDQPCLGAFGGEQEEVPLPSRPCPLLLLSLLCLPYPAPALALAPALVAYGGD